MLLIEKKSVESILQAVQIARASVYKWTTVILSGIIVPFVPLVTNDESMQMGTNLDVFLVGL